MSIPCAASAPETFEREANGRFAKGNKGGPGNPFGRRLAAAREAALEVAGPEQIRAIMEAMVEKACNGDLGAAKFVFSYAVGKPAPMKEPDLVDVDEFEVAKAKRVPHSEAVTALLDMPVEKATDMAGQEPAPELTEFFEDPDAFMAKAAAEAGYELVEEEDPRSRVRQNAGERAEHAEHAVAGDVDGGEGCPRSGERGYEKREWSQKDDAYRIVGYFLLNNEFPADSPFGPLPDGTDPAVVEEYKRTLREFSRALKKGKRDPDSPFVPSSDGAATAVCAGS